MLSCPDLAQCAPGEKGSWVPVWYQREMAQELVQIAGVAEELQKADAQIEQLELAKREIDKQVAALQLTVVSVQSTRGALRANIDSLEHQKRRRTRWAIGATVVGVLLAGALSAGLYVAGN